MNLANKLTLLRVGLVPIFVGILLYGSSPHMPLWAAVLFLTASGTDYLDGLVARKFNMITTFGKFLDPLADKLLVAAGIICLTYYERCPPVVGILILSRELIVTGFRAVAAGQGVVLAADVWGKIKTLLQNIAILAALAGMVWATVESFSIWLLWAAAGMTVFSGYNYLHKNWALIGDDW